MSSLCAGRLPFWVLTLAVLLPTPASLAQEAARSLAGLTLETGEIDGALFQLAVPSSWNGKLLLHAHGYRLAEEPLRAELDLGDEAYRHFLSAGWMLAITSYRRNGVIVGDGIRDLENLWDHVAATHARPRTTILEGFSMGGLIVTLIAEDLIAEEEPERFSGAVAAGAALTNPRLPSELTYAPRIPLLFLTNRSEIFGPRDYLAKAAASNPVPVLWEVGRDGHVNVNHVERRTAIEAVARWIESGRVERNFDPTHEITQESTATVGEGRAAGFVRRITRSYGNVFSSFGPADLEALGIHKGDTFHVVTTAGTFTFTYGTTFSDVPRGKPIAFPTADGEVLFAVNYGNAAAALKVDEGDPLTVVKE
ncbi:MAG: SAM hydroxide adenosyltransferase [Thermoanaerobaculia bacterium]